MPWQYQSVTFPSGAMRNYTYDDQGRLTQMTNLTSGNANLATYAYGYDFNYTSGQNTMLGQRTSLTATVPSQSLNNSLFKYEYDSAYQLKKATYPNVAPLNGEVDSWTYDAIGNRLTSTVNSTTQTYTYQKIGSNPLNWQRLLSDGVNSYTYDGNGNTATKTGLTFTWNYDDRMTGITGTSSYSYDYQGRRGSKTVGTTTTYLYDGLNLIREGGASTADYLFGPGIDEPLAMNRAGSIYYYGVDALGSAAVVSNSSGTVQNSYLYDAWGQTRTQTGTLTNPFGYTAREFGEAGTLFYRARYYQPSIGRFLQEDPIINPAGLSEVARRSVRPRRNAAFQQALYVPRASAEIRLLAGPSDYTYVRSTPTLANDPLGLLGEPNPVPGQPYCDWGNCTSPVCPPKPCGPWGTCMRDCTAPLFDVPWWLTTGLAVGSYFYPPVGAGVAIYYGGAAAFCAFHCAAMGGCSPW